MIEAVTTSPLFGIVLCIGTFQIGRWVQKKTGLTLANPLVIAILLCIGVLLIFDIPYEDFAIGGDIVNMMLGPATAVLALNIYNQYAVLKRHFVPVLVGCTAGSLFSLASVLLLCRLSHIPCLFLASTSMNHSYNAVYVDGQWLLVDATWDDPDQGSAARSDYLLKTPAEMPDHVVDGGGVTRDELFTFGRTYYSYLIDETGVAGGMTQTQMADLLYEKGLFLGTDLGYELDRAPTRAEAAVLFVRVLAARAKRSRETPPPPLPTFRSGRPITLRCSTARG